MSDDKKPYPYKNKPFMLRLDDDVKARCQELADADGRTLTNWLQRQLELITTKKPAKRTAPPPPDLDV